MQFRQLDQITEIQPGERVVAVRKLLAEEHYLKDHFPHFPVMPGVLMLEAMFQASAWLVRASDDFAQAMVVLSEARNVKYKDFVQPGQQLVVTAEIAKRDGRFTTLKAEGQVDGNIAVNARLILESYNQADHDPSLEPLDRHMRVEMRKTYADLIPASAPTV